MEVHQTSPAVDEMLPDWHLIATLLGGTRAMRAAGEQYLPRWSREDPRDYERRLRISTLLPALQQTIVEMTGRLFSETVELDANAPAWIRDEVWPDADKLDGNGHTFLREWWRVGLAFGLAHVLVEAPAAPEVRTQADQRRAGVRPYWIAIHPSRVLGWRLGSDGQLEQLRVTWSRTEPTEFGETVVPQVRVYQLAGGVCVVRVFEKRKTQDGREDWTEVDLIQTGLERIPLATFYSGKTGPLQAVPPLREMAFLNAKHWAQQSATDSLLQTASVPILAAIGFDGQAIEVGAKSAVEIPMGGDLKYVEHTGKAIGVGRESLKDLEAQMKAIGAKLIEPGSGSKTATQAGEEAASANSALAGWLQNFTDAVASLLDMTAMYRGDLTGGGVVIHADLDPDSAPVETMNVLTRMHAQRTLSGQTLFGEAKRRGMISAESTWEDEQERIATETPDGGDNVTP